MPGETAPCSATARVCAGGDILRNEQLSIGDSVAKKHVTWRGKETILKIWKIWKKRGGIFGKKFHVKAHERP